MKGMFRCPHCGQVYPIGERLAGRQVKCFACRKTFQVPSVCPGEASPAPKVQPSCPTPPPKRRWLVAGGVGAAVLLVLGIGLFVAGRSWGTQERADGGSAPIASVAQTGEPVVPPAAPSQAPQSGPIQASPPAAARAKPTAGARTAVTGPRASRKASQGRKPAPPPEGEQAAKALEAGAGPPKAGLPPAKPAAQPKLSQDKVETPFSEPYDWFRAGGGGRYLLFFTKASKTLAVFDLTATKLIGSIEVPSDDALAAAGLDKVLVVLPGQRLVLRYDLKTLQREASAVIEGDQPVRATLMGFSGHGPLLLWAHGDVVLWDVERMRPMAVPGQVLRGNREYGYDFRVSADGQAFVGWTTGVSGQQFATMFVDSSPPRIVQTPDAWGVNGMWAMPSADGSLLFVHDASIFNAAMKRVGGDGIKGKGVPFPTEDPRWFVVVRPGKDAKRSSEADLCLASSFQSVLTVKDLEPVCTAMLPTFFGHCRGEPRVRYLPSARLLVTLPDDNRRLVVRRLDWIEELDRSGRDYLFVTSIPKPIAGPGATYTYRIEVVSKAGGVKYKLESGPPGMRVNENGLVQWKPGKQAPGSAVNAVVGIRDASNKEALHAFEITFGPVARAPGKAPPALAGPSPTPGKPQAGATPPPPPPVTAFTQVDKRRLQIPSGTFKIVPGLGGDTLLVIQGRQLAVLGPDGVTLKQKHTFDKSYMDVAERPKYYVAVADKPPSIDLIDKGRTSPRSSFKFPCLQPTDLALHPTRPFCYVAYKHGVDVPRYRFLVFNEQTGTGRDSDDYIGTWLAVDPKGRWLMAGYRDIYERGSRLLINPDRLHLIPEYGSIDWLIRYRLDRNGLPAPSEAIMKSGGNGTGLRMSPDGARVTYLSNVGYPPFSRNLAGWDPADLKKMPVPYALKDKASCTELTFHPSLPLVAAPGKNSVVLLHRETGDSEENRLTLGPEDVANGDITRLFFSPDGQHLILVLRHGEVSSLLQAGLRLTPPELKAAQGRRSAPAAPPERTAAAAPAAKVPLVKLDAFKGTAGEELSTKDIAARCAESVVVITTRDASGSGFLVGSEGYVLTAAHCVPDEEGIEVVYRKGPGDQAASRRAAAKLLFAGEGQDLALLKINVTGPLPAVRLGLGKVSSGERVCVIGNPGLGDTILDHTVTEGVVSNPHREIEGLRLIQTSAQVNPGTSGGPMFNSRGEVVGMVALKGRIEGAGFALPAQSLARFLLACAKTDGANGAIRRLWTEAATARRVEAAYLGLDQDAVRLRKTDGSEFSVAVKKLDEADQEFLRILAAAAADATGKPGSRR